MASGGALPPPPLPNVPQRSAAAAPRRPASAPRGRAGSGCPTPSRQARGLRQTWRRRAIGPRARWQARHRLRRCRAEWRLREPFIPPSRHGGRKRHTLVDTLGLLLSVIVLPADIQDRYAAIDLLRKTGARFPFAERIFADGGYAVAQTAAAVRSAGCWKTESVKRSDGDRLVVLLKALDR